MLKKVLAVVGLSFLLTGCGSPPAQANYKTNTYGNESRKTEAQQKILDKTQPVPVLTSSLQRANLIKRLKMLNHPNAISYVYLLSNAGQIVAFFPIKGTISSLNEHLTTQTQMVAGLGLGAHYGHSHIVNSPSLSGVYGNQGSGIFFFTTSGTLVQWNGMYLLTSTPLMLHVQPLVTQSVK